MRVVEEPTLGDTTASSRAGSCFGHYRLRRLLGHGGFGEVYEAHDTMMDRVVALKLLAAAYSQNDVFRQRLHREARAAGRLHEPHVVPIHQCGEIDGQLYIDMRLIEGTDLLTVLARTGPLNPARAVAIVHQIAAALDAAHKAQMVHRDVKPANILLSGDDFACLVDFGLATAATDAKLTSSGTTIGTFAYMAPERLNNAEVSRCADIYALACVLYECLTGSPPYAIGDLPALISAHLTAPIPRPSRHRPQIPAAFDDVIARGMAKRPDDRYASAGELARAAHRALTAPDQDDADTILARTQAAATGDRTQDPAAGKRPGSSQTSTQAAGHPDNAQSADEEFDIKELFAGPGGERVKELLASLRGARQAPPGKERHLLPSLRRWRQRRGPSQVELPFHGQLSPTGVAVDTTGNVYVTDDDNNRVLKLAAGSTTPVELPFTGLNWLRALAVDTTDNVYLAEPGPRRVLKLPARSTTPIELAFTGLNRPWAVAADTTGNVYVIDVNLDTSSGRVLKLPAGSTTPIELPFTGLNQPWAVTVDATGTVYITDVGNGRVLKLPAGSTTQVELPFAGLSHPDGVAVDTAGNVYVTDNNGPLRQPGGRVLKLPAGSTTPVELPFTGLSHPDGVAVDTAGNVYVTDNNRVLKLPVG